MATNEPAVDDEVDELSHTVSELWLIVHEQQRQLKACQAELRRLAARRESATPAPEVPA